MFSHARFLGTEHSLGLPDFKTLLEDISSGGGGGASDSLAWSAALEAGRSLAVRTPLTAAIDASFYGSSSDSNDVDGLGLDSFNDVWGLSSQHDGTVSIDDDELYGFTSLGGASPEAVGKRKIDHACIKLDISSGR